MIEPGDYSAVQSRLERLKEQDAVAAAALVHDAAAHAAGQAGASPGEVLHLLSLDPAAGNEREERLRAEFYGYVVQRLGDRED